MPLPKDPAKIEEWKRKIAFKEMSFKKNPYYIEESIKMTIKNIVPEELSSKELFYFHAQNHVFFKSMPENLNLEDVVGSHLDIIKEFEKRRFMHKSKDELDDITDEIINFDEEDKDEKQQEQ